MYIHTSQSQPTVIVSLKLNTHTYRLREYKHLGSTIFDGPHVERPQMPGLIQYCRGEGASRTLALAKVAVQSRSIHAFVHSSLQHYMRSTWIRN